MNSGIYILKWEDCPYYYYGSSKDLERRKRNHFNRLKNGKHENFILLGLYIKYGLPKFEVLEYCKADEIKASEQCYLDKAKCDANNVNLLYSVTGDGKIISEETRQKISVSLMGRTFSQSHLQNLKIANQGENNPRYNKPVLESTRQKIGLANVGAKNGRAKKVINIYTGEIFGCAKDALPNYSRGKYQNFILKLKGNVSNNTPFRYLETKLINKIPCGDDAVAPSVKQEAHRSLADG